MAGGSISEPGVEVQQEFVTVSPTILQPQLPTVVIGPCFQVVSAFDDDGNPQEEAFAGTYRDGQGTISYDLPNLTAQAALAGFESDLRVWLVTGAATTELNALSDEDVIIDDASGATYTNATRAFVDGAQLFLQIGVEAGDYVRFTWRGEVIDVEVESVDTDTQLTLVSSPLNEDLASLTYDVVRNAAQFIFDSATQANVEVGGAADWLRFSAALLKEDGITAGDYLGSLGDSLTVLLTGSLNFLEGSDGATGDTIFTSAGASFLTSVGARGSVSGELLLVGGSGDAQVFRDVLQVVSGTQIIIETGEGVGGSTLTYAVGDDAGSAYTAGTGATDGTGNTLTVTAGDLNTSIPNTAGTPDQTTYVELSSGVYPVTSVDSATQVTITGTAASQNLSGEDPVFLLETANAADGATGALTDFVSISQDFTTLADDSTESIIINDNEAEAISSVTDADNLVLSSSFAASANSIPWAAVLTAASLQVSWDPDNDLITIQLERAAGLTSNTYAEVEDAIENNLNAAYNVLASDQINASLGGSVGTGLVAITDADLPLPLELDGGADEEQLVLDADLLGSTTPTANVYVSYKALRLDVSDQASSPVLLSIDDSASRLSLLGAANTDNPLGLGVELALANSVNRSVRAIGVGAVTSTKPNGTAAAHSSALQFLEGKDVYTLVQMTQDPVPHGLLDTHVTAMSAPDQKSERIGFFSQALPTYAQAEVIASGTDGNTATVVGVNPAEFSSSENFSLRGVQAGDILVVSARASSTDSPDVVNGTVGPLYGIEVLGIKTGDDFVLELDGTASGIATAWNNQVDVDFTVYRPGAAISQPADQAEAVAKVGEGFANRRMFHIWPDLVTADVEGSEQLIEGFYLAAGWAGKNGAVAPQQGLSRTTVAGFSGLSNSNGYFSRAQLARMAGGGTFITVQDGQGQPLRCRHQLATDVSSIQRRELSITRLVDYTAKFLRLALNKPVGKFNITQSFLDGLATTVQGLLRSLIEANVLIDAALLSLSVNPDLPDTIDIIISIDVPFPCNYINVTLQI